MQKKIYVDLSCDKISGQQEMQRKLREGVIKRGIYADKDKANILVYSQVPFNDNIVDEWRKFKKQGKRIVFIHHYFLREKYKNYALFKLKGLFEIIDLHFVTGKDSDIYEDCVKTKKPVIVYEQGGVNQIDIFDKHFREWYEKVRNSICFVGRKSKGLDDFIEYTSQERFKDWKKHIFCTEDIDINKSYVQHINLHGDELFEEISKYEFIYFNCDWIAPSHHLEMCLQEAICCGTIVLIGSKIRKYFDKDFQKQCFPKLEEITDYEVLQQAQLRFLFENFKSQNEIIEKNIDNILFTFR